MHFDRLKAFGLLLVSISFCLIFGVVDAFAVPQTIQIRSAADLDLIRETPDADFELMEDIDLAAVTDFRPIGKGPAGPFTGTFEGNNHTIHNLTINARPQTVEQTNAILVEDCIGLFAITDGASIQNLKLEDVSVFGESMVGSLVGQCRQTTVTNCSAVGTVSGQVQVGGLIGFMGDSDVVNCMTDVNVGLVSDAHVSFWVGGIVGHAHPYRFPGRASTNTGDGSSLNSCMALGDVYGGFTTGGIVGNFHGSTGSDCYAFGNVETQFNIAGGLIGYIQTEAGIDFLSPTPLQTTFTNSHAFGTVTCNEFGFAPRAPLEGSSAGGFVGYCEGGLIDSGPSLQPLVDISFCSASGDVFSLEPSPSFTIQTGGFVGFIEVDTLIRNCRAEGDANGMMGSTGGFVGWGEGVIEDSVSEGNVVAATRSGGFAGQVDSTSLKVRSEPGPFRGKFTRCASFGNASSPDQNPTSIITGIGGFVGYSFGGVEFIGCESHGTATSISEFSGFTGGFIGHTSNDTIIECFSTGDVVTSFGKAGGFIGHHRLDAGLQVDNCFSTGDVVYNGNDTPASIGGFIGGADNTATISNCYSVGNINVAGPTAGGFVGNFSRLTFTGCYWDTSTADKPFSSFEDISTFVSILASGEYQAGADFNGDLVVDFSDIGPFIAQLSQNSADVIQPAGVNGRTTAQMQQQMTFIGWDFDNIWEIIDSPSYPSFK